MAVWLVMVLSFVSCVLSQAPGDGDPLCIQAVVDGITSPFFQYHPTYPANERPLMDSRDYTGLLQGGNPPVWQHVDNDNNNTVIYRSYQRKIILIVCVCRYNEFQAAYSIQLYLSCEIYSVVFVSCLICDFIPSLPHGLFAAYMALNRFH